MDDMIIIIDPPTPFSSEDEWRRFATSMDEAQPTTQILAMRLLARTMLAAFAAGGLDAAIEAYREPVLPPG